MIRSSSSIVAFALVAAALLPDVAAAQPGPPPPPPPRAEHDGIDREGLVLGVSFGPAMLGLDDDGAASPEPDGDPIGGVAIEVRLGGMISRRVALLATLPLVFAEAGGFRYSQASALVGARFFPSGVFWVEAAVGTGAFEMRYEDVVVDYEYRLSHGRSLYAGAGVELFRGDRFALSFEGKVMATHYGDDRAVLAYAGLIGLTWY